MRVIVQQAGFESDKPISPGQIVTVMVRGPASVLSNGSEVVVSPQTCAITKVEKP